MKKRSVTKKGAKMRKSQKTGANKRYVVSNISPRNIFRNNHRARMTLFAALFAVVGVAVLIRSFANPLYSSNPNEVVLEYVAPHQHVTDTQGLQSPTWQPFTLYGNGLLVCGQNSHDPFVAPQPAHNHEEYNAGAAPTARMLTKTEMTTLIQGVRDTGFEQLNAEYYKLPVSQLLYTVRLVTKGVEKDVLYYNDVPPPTAYVKTLALLKASCDRTTETFVSDKVTLRAKVDVTTKGQPVTALEQIDSTVIPAVKNALQKTKDTKQKNQAKIAANQEITENDDYIETISGQVAQDLQRVANGKSKKFVTLDGSTYEIGIDPELPQVNNPLDIDIHKLRGTQQNNAKEDVSALGRLNISSKVSAAAVPAPEPFRVVILLPASGGSTGKLDDARERGDRARDWFCAEIGRCFRYQGVEVIRGSRSMDFYNTCHSGNYCAGNQLLNVMQNVADVDKGTVYKQDVITLVVPGWKTNTLGTSGTKACGWGSLGGNISAVDLYQTEPINGYSCSRLTKSMAHEWAHNVALGHNSECTYRNLLDGPPGCRYSNDCVIVGNNGPRCVFNSNQTTKLRNDLEHFPVPSTIIYGMVRNAATGAGIPNISLNTCIGNHSTVTTNSEGKWSLRVSDGTGFCLRVASTIPSTYNQKPTTNNQPEHAGATTFEYQVAGKNCYHNSTCGTNTQSWDLSQDGSYTFSYTPITK